jgi:hypothetical protein
MAMTEEERDDLLLGIFIQLSRVLDALYILAGPEKSNQLDSLHRDGGLLSSDPYIKYGDES